MPDNQDVDLQKRVEILERYVALMLSSSGATWSYERGLHMPLYPLNEATNMIMGYFPWDPKSLDKGG